MSHWCLSPFFSLTHTGFFSISFFSRLRIFVWHINEHWQSLKNGFCWKIKRKEKGSKLPRERKKRGKKMFASQKWHFRCQIKTKYILWLVCNCEPVLIILTSDFLQQLLPHTTSASYATLTVIHLCKDIRHLAAVKWFRVKCIISNTSTHRSRVPCYIQKCNKLFHSPPRSHSTSCCYLCVILTMYKFYY